MSSDYFRGKNEVLNKVIKSLKEDYITLDSLKEKPLFNKIKIIKSFVILKNCILIMFIINY